MTNNHFEKRIQEKLNQFEIEPSGNLLENIFERRAAKSASFLRFSLYKLGIAMLGLAILTTVIVLNWNSSGKRVDMADKNQSSIVAGNGPSVGLKNIQAKVEEDLSLPDNLKRNGVSDNHNVEKAGSVKRLKGHPERGIKNTHSISRNNITGGSDFKNQFRQPVKKSFDAKNISIGRHSDRLVFRENLYAEKGEFNDNGENIEARYFNIDAPNRPLVSSVNHKGNSLLVVYNSVDEDRTEKLNLDYLFLKPIHGMSKGNNDKEQVALINYNPYQNSVRHRKPVYVDVLFSPIISFHGVNGKDALNDSYKSMSKTNFNKQYGLRVSYPISRKVNIFAGLGYMQLATIFKGDVVNSEDAVRYQTITNYINDPVLGTIAVSHVDTINYHKNDAVHYNFKNTYQIMNLPIGLSYNLSHKKFDFALHGSTILNLYTNAKGVNADFANHQTNEFNSNKKHFGIGGGISFMVAYKLSTRFKLIVEPGLQYFTINSRKNGNVVNEKVLNNGLSLGLRYSVF